MVGIRLRLASGDMGRGGNSSRRANRQRQTPGSQKRHMSAKRLFVSTILSDLKYAIRGLVRNPGFTTIAAITLALGIGVNTAIFSAVNSVVFLPLAYEAPDRLVRIYGTLSSRNLNTANFSALDARDLNAQSTTFDEIAVFDWGSVDLTGIGDPEVVRTANVSANFFATLGSRPSIGRLFLPEDELEGTDRVAIVTDGFWRGRLGGEGELLGRAITLSGVEHAIIGVLGQDFEEPSSAGPPNMTQVWVPVEMSGVVAGNRGTPWLRALGRLAEGATLQQAEQELNTIAAALSAEYPSTNPADSGVRLVSLHESIWGDTGIWLRRTVVASMSVGGRQ